VMLARERTESIEAILDQVNCSAASHENCYDICRFWIKKLT
jgi:hypothetical protein